ncbi:hypothetical protein, partial [Burkholderia cenocepacia]|uniref:hypothetical protein n=1 Tax=Burkholderia cenocepacia TaxID=95486 RepID=UPI001B97576F
TIVFGTLHFGGSPVGELVLETRFSRIPREPPPSTFNYARDIAGPTSGSRSKMKKGSFMIRSRLDLARRTNRTTRSSSSIRERPR